MDKREHAQLLADQIQPLLMLIDGLAETLNQEDIDLLEESKETLLEHISMQQSAMTLTMAFGIDTDTTEEQFKVKTLKALIELINVRKEYKAALIEMKEKQVKKQQNRAELMKIFSNL